MILDVISILQLSTSAVLLALFGVLWYRQHHRRRREAQRLVRVQSETPLTGPDRDLLFSKRQMILEALNHDTSALLGGRLQVRHIMSPSSYRVSPKTPADDVARTMREKCIHHVLVCEPEGHLLGIITARDLLLREADTAGEIMTPSPPTIEPDALISPAVTLLIKQQISCLPVVEGARICGVVTVTDIMMAFQCVLQSLQRLEVEGHAGGAEMVEAGG